MRLYAHRLASVIVVSVLMCLCHIPSAAACPCDCNNDCQVTVDEIVSSIDVALGTAPLGSCQTADSNIDGEVSIDELISCVDAALFGCSDCNNHPGCNNNGVVTPPEECDDGGICVGGSNAGTHCVVESQCQGNGVCDAGSNIGRTCSSEAECPDSICIHCKPFGGDGCAANCTNETDIPVTLETRMVSGVDLQPGTSGVVVHSDVLTVPMPLSGRFTLTIGKEGADGLISFVIRAASVDFPRVVIPALVDACIRMPALQTCGGTLFEADGSPSQSCTPGFTGTNLCPAPLPCTSVFGPDNAASGVISCAAAGLSGSDVTYISDASGSSRLTFANQGPIGSALGFAALSIGQADAPTECVDSDPPAIRGTPLVVPLTTGTATGGIRDTSGALKAFGVFGEPTDCQLLFSNPPTLTGLGLAGSAPIRDFGSFGDAVLTLQLLAH